MAEEVTYVPGSKLSSQPEESYSGHSKDPWCDLCFEESGQMIKVDGFCPECNCFICKACLDAHKKSPASRNHVIMRGVRMPKSQGEKPVKYPDCTKHIGKITNHFCPNHSEMVCSRCIETSHPLCKTSAILDLCKNLGSQDVHDFKTFVTSIQASVIATKSTVEKNLTDVEVQKKGIMKEIYDFRGKVMAKVEQLCSEMISEVNTACSQTTSDMSHQILTLSDLSHSLKETISNISKSAGSKFGPNLFIRIQDLIKNARHIEKEIEEMNKDIATVEFTFILSPKISSFISDANDLGKITTEMRKLGTLKTKPKLAFPPVPEHNVKSKARGRQLDIKKIRPSKLSPLNVKAAGDRDDCKVEGMDFTSDGSIIIGDWRNRKVKIFSSKNKFLSAIVLPGKPYDVTVLNDTTVMTTTDEEKRYTIDISDPRGIFVQQAAANGYCITGMTTFEDKLVVVRWNEPRCVKMITPDGREVWSASVDDIGKQLFKSPYSVAAIVIDEQPTILVTDWGKESLTVLGANDGSLLKTIDLKGLAPRGLTVDDSGIIYVCLTKTSEIYAWTSDLKQSRVILPASSLQMDPMDILYNHATRELLISYRCSDEVDRFLLTEK